VIVFFRLNLANNNRGLGTGGRIISKLIAKGLNAPNSVKDQSAAGQLGKHFYHTVYNWAGM